MKLRLATTAAAVCVALLAGGVVALAPAARAAGEGGAAAGSAAAGSASVARAGTATGAGATAVPAAGAGAAGAGAAGGADAVTAKRLAELRRKLLKDDDFVENDELNRDPFHSYLRLFAERTVARGKKGSAATAVFDRVGLEELTLIAVVSGDAQPIAMFRDASGLGRSVKKGEYLSRAAVRVTKILSDRVIVEVNEQSGTGEPRVVEKAILVNPEESP